MCAPETSSQKDFWERQKDSAAGSPCGVVGWRRAMQSFPAGGFLKNLLNWPIEETAPHARGPNIKLQWSLLASLVAQLVKNLPAVRETWVRSLGWEDPLEEGEATHPVSWPGEFHAMYSHAKSQTWLSDFHLHYAYWALSFFTSLPLSQRPDRQKPFPETRGMGRSWGGGAEAWRWPTMPLPSGSESEAGGPRRGGIFPWGNFIEFWWLYWMICFNDWSETVLDLRRPGSPGVSLTTVPGWG